MRVDSFLSLAHAELNVDFYTGVPDSQLKPLCDTLYQKHGLSKTHIVAANEGGAVGLAAGYYIATGKPALVYLQNSGIGNIVNPVASLLNEEVYGIPCLFVVGWRGEPGTKDEPQHIFQGEVTVELLEIMGIKCFILSKETSEQDLLEFFQQAKVLFVQGRSVAVVVCKDALHADGSVHYGNQYTLSREDAICSIVLNSSENDIFVSTTGKTSRELFEIRQQQGQSHEKDFLTVGSMGHASMIAMGIALEHQDRTVWCIDGDGASVMHMGNLMIVAKSNCDNLIHVIINNGAHESVGGMPVVQGCADLYSIAKAAGYRGCFKAANQEELMQSVVLAKETTGPILIEVLAALGSRDNLGRPTTTPQQNKVALMKFLERE